MVKCQRREMHLNLATGKGGGGGGGVKRDASCWWPGHL